MGRQRHPQHSKTCLPDKANARPLTNELQEAGLPNKTNNGPPTNKLQEVSLPNKANAGPLTNKLQEALIDLPTTSGIWNYGHLIGDHVA